MFTWPVFSAPPAPWPSPSSSAAHAAPIRTRTRAGAISLSMRIRFPLLSRASYFTHTYLIRSTRRRGSSHGAAVRTRNEVGEPARAGLRGPGLGGEVNPDHAEALRVTLRPLEVVEQRPGEIPGQWNPLVERTVRSRHVLTQIRDATIVLDEPVDSRLLLEGRAVFGDQDLCRPVLAVDPGQDGGEALGFHGPPHRGHFHARRRVRPCAERSGEIPAGTPRSRTRTHGVPAVVVHAAEEERLGGGLEIAVQHELHVGHAAEVLNELA